MEYIQLLQKFSNNNTLFNCFCTQIYITGLLKSNFILPKYIMNNSNCILKMFVNFNILKEYTFELDICFKELNLNYFEIKYINIWKVCHFILNFLHHFNSCLKIYY